MKRMSLVFAATVVALPFGNLRKPEIARALKTAASVCAARRQPVAETPSVPFTPFAPSAALIELIAFYRITPFPSRCDGRLQVLARAPAEAESRAG
jgi:hypothetical protein